MAGVSELPDAAESVVFIVLIVALIYVLAEGLEAAPVLEFETEADDVIEDAYGEVEETLAGWSNG